MAKASKQNTPVSSQTSIPSSVPNKTPKGGKKPNLPKVIPAKQGK